MKGLILKDIYNMKGMVKSMLFLLVVFSLAFKEQGIATIVVMFAVTSTVLVINSLALDEVHQWYQMAYTMPVTRRQTVLGKYIISMLYAAMGVCIGILDSVVLSAVGWFTQDINFITVASIGSVGFLMAILFISLLLPMNFKFGVQKARLLLMALVAVPVLLVTAITALGVVFPGMMLYGGIKLSSNVIVFGSITAVAAIVILSFFISVRIMEKKEF